MKQIFFRKMKMYLNVLSVLKKYKTIWVSSLPFKEEEELFESHLQGIETKSQSLQGSNGISEHKKQLEKEMLEACLVVCGAGSAYANHIKNQEEKAKFDFSKTDLAKGNDKDVYYRCMGVSQAASEIITELLPYNINSANFDAITTAAIAFNQLIAVPREVIKSTKTTNEGIADIYNACDDLLNDRLDNMMAVYKSSHTEFYTEYSNARTIGGWSKKKNADNQVQS